MLSVNERNSKLVESYCNGKSLVGVARKFKVSVGTVLTALQEASVQVRKEKAGRSKFSPEQDADIVKRYKDGESTTSIATVYGVSRSCIVYRLHKSGVYLVTKVKDTVFDEIDSEEKAYYFGLLCADGWISKLETSPCVGLYLKAEDRNIVEGFMKMFCDKEIRAVKRNGVVAGYQADINSKRLVEKLIEYGIDNDKSHTLRFPTCVPDEYLCDFVRGYFDGDGSISGNQTSFVGTKWFIEKLIKVMSENANVSNKVTPFPVNADKGNTITKSIAWSGINQARKIRDWMYRNGTSTIYIKRKHDRYYSID